MAKKRKCEEYLGLAKCVRAYDHAGDCWDEFYARKRRLVRLLATWHKWATLNLAPSAAEWDKLLSATEREVKRG